ncbi:hypothetical protein ACGFIK_10480 [Micromonospora sp. NPDC048871]|uniref:hypothetical protein n=1 Tax=unclassified Micromonospora TaxID=2617518 RepID=UPI002E12B4D8|nr:hypothetical protein OIE53_22515 [Micromonospora sp. NBC_01739]
MVIGQGNRPRWLIGVAAVAVVSVALAAGLIIGFTLPPTANTSDLPQSITVNGATYDRVHLVTLRTTFQDSVDVQVPATSQPIVVRASCRLAVLHTSSANSALELDLSWTRTGGNAADTPETQDAQFLLCPHRHGQDLTRTIDPAWLPRTGNQLRLAWRQLDTFADIPSASPASWALAVYTAP